MAQLELPMTDIMNVIDDIVKKPSVKTAMELNNVDNTHDKDKYVKGVIDQGGDGKQNIRFYYQNMNNVVTTASWFPAFSSSGADAGSIVIKPISKENLINTLGVNDKQNITNGIVTGDVDWNTLTTAGAYKIEKCNMTEANHAPIGVHNYGILHVIVSGFNNETRISQIYIPDTVASDPTHGMRIRTQNVTNWAAWHILMTDADGVKKSGDTMTGNLTVPYIYSDGIAARTGGKHVVLKTIGADANGDSIIIGGGALVIVGSGESADALKTALPIANTSEEMYISSDGNIHFYTNCQNIGNKIHSYISSAGVVNANYFLSLSGTKNWISGLKDQALISCNNNNRENTFVCLANGKGRDGTFGIASYSVSTAGDNPNDSLYVYYAKASEISKGDSGAVAYKTILMDSNGNATFANKVSAQSFTGAIKDVGVTKHDIYFNYSDAGLETANWLCAWNDHTGGGYEIRALHKDKLKSLLGIPFTKKGSLENLSTSLFDLTNVHLYYISDDIAFISGNAKILKNQAITSTIYVCQTQNLIFGNEFNNKSYSIGDVAINVSESSNAKTYTSLEVMYSGGYTILAIAKPNNSSYINTSLEFINFHHFITNCSWK